MLWVGDNSKWSENEWSQNEWYQNRWFQEMQKHWDREVRTASLCESLYAFQTNPEAIQIFLEDRVWSGEEDFTLPALVRWNLLEECKKLHGQDWSTKWFERWAKRSKTSNNYFPTNAEKDSTIWIRQWAWEPFGDLQRELCQQKTRILQRAVSEIPLEQFLHVRKASVTDWPLEVDKKWPLKRQYCTRQIRSSSQRPRRQLDKIYYRRLKSTSGQHKGTQSSREARLPDIKR